MEAHVDKSHLHEPLHINEVSIHFLKGECCWAVTYNCNDKLLDTVYKYDDEFVGHFLTTVLILGKF